MSKMSRIILFLALLIALVPTCRAQDSAFKKTKFSSVQQSKEVDVDLSITDSKILVKGRKKSNLDIEVPFASIDSMTYEFAERHRVAEGAGTIVLSPLAAVIIMATKTKSYWLTIGYGAANAKQEVVLHLDKSEYKAVIDTLEARTGKKVVVEDAKTSTVNPTTDSKDVDELVPFPMDQVAAALGPAMESEGCHVKEARAARVLCKRDRGASERNGSGGEEVTASLDTSGSQTRVRIVTGKGFVGRMGKKNWSTSIFKGMQQRLQQPAAN